MKRKVIVFIILMFIYFGVSADNEATINNIKVNGKECTCVEYNCSIEIDASSAKITYDLVSSKATVDRASGFSVDLISNVSVIKIVVSNTLDDGSKVENTYAITINKHEKSNDYSLKSLKVNGNDITLSEGVYVYSYQAEYSDEELLIEAVTNDSNAIVKKEDKYSFELEKSSIAIDFEVKAENGDSKTYRIVVSRGEKPNTYLKSLKLDHGDIDFKKDVLDYNFNVDYSVNELLIEATSEDDNAKVKIEKEALVVGENTIKIIVTNDEVSTTYTLVVNRLPNLDKSLANLKSLKINEYSKLDFEPNVLEYNLKFSDIPDKLTIDAKPQEADAKVEIIDNEKLVNHHKVIIRVSMEENYIIREYVLNIIEEKGIVSNKKNILIAIVVLVIVIIILLILHFKEKKAKRRYKLNYILNMKKKKDKVKEKEEEIEII